MDMLSMMLSMMYDVNDVVNGARLNPVILFVSIGLMMSISDRTAVRVENTRTVRVRRTRTSTRTSTNNHYDCNREFREASLSILPRKNPTLWNADVKKFSPFQLLPPGYGGTSTRSLHVTPKLGLKKLTGLQLFIDWTSHVTLHEDRGQSFQLLNEIPRAMVRRTNQRMHHGWQSRAQEISRFASPSSISNYS